MRNLRRTLGAYCAEERGCFALEPAGELARDLRPDLVKYVRARSCSEQQLRPDVDAPTRLHKGLRHGTDGLSH